MSRRAFVPGVIQILHGPQVSNNRVGKHRLERWTFRNPRIFIFFGRQGLLQDGRIIVFSDLPLWYADTLTSQECPIVVRLLGQTNCGRCPSHVFGATFLAPVSFGHHKFDPLIPYSRLGVLDDTPARAKDVSAMVISLHILPTSVCLL